MLSDQEIMNMIGEEKNLPENFRESLKLKNKSNRAYRECDIRARTEYAQYAVEDLLRIRSWDNLGIEQLPDIISRIYSK